MSDLLSVEHSHGYLDSILSPLQHSANYNMLMGRLGGVALLVMWRCSGALFACSHFLSVHGSSLMLLSCLLLGFPPRMTQK